MFLSNTPHTYVSHREYLYPTVSHIFIFRFIISLRDISLLLSKGTGAEDFMGSIGVEVLHTLNPAIHIVPLLLTRLQGYLLYRE